MSDPVIGGALSNIAGLEKPATTLIERISDAIGGIALPRQIVRVAKAEAKAEIIRAEARFQISEMEERALQRMIREEGYKQENIESIIVQALPSLKHDSKPEDVERDRITHFFDQSRLISDKEMQSMWARILSTEANTPGSISKRTVNLVASLDKSDAILFTKLCTFAWMITDLTLMVESKENRIFKDQGINFMSLVHLDSIGLIRFDDVSGFARKETPREFTLRYYGSPIILEHRNAEGAFHVGNAIFTQNGMELARICDPKPSQAYLEYMIQTWANSNFAPRSPWPTGI